MEPFYKTGILTWSNMKSAGLTNVINNDSASLNVLVIPISQHAPYSTRVLEVTRLNKMQSLLT